MVNDKLGIKLILAVQGAEYWTVSRPIQALANQGFGKDVPIVHPLPIGQHAGSHLQHLNAIGQLPPLKRSSVLLLGVGGSLSPRYQVGDVVLLRTVQQVLVPTSGRLMGLRGMAGREILEDGTVEDSNPVLLTDAALVQSLHRVLVSAFAKRTCPPQIGVEHGITSDRIITKPNQKQTLGEGYQASVVDMESSFALGFLRAEQAHVAIVRVISDGANTELPDLNAAVSPSGQLQSLILAKQLIQQPIAAAHLIQGSIRGLRRLQAVTIALLEACC